MKDIVILAGSMPWSVLSLCKCACRHNVKAYVVCVKNGWGRKYAKSRLVYKAYDCLENGIDMFWQRFFSENQFSDKPILFVTSDYVCQIVEQNRFFYEKQFTLCMASSYIINSFIDKNQASVEANRHGLTVPNTQEIHNDDDISSIGKSFQFPVIVKPVTFQDHSNAGFKTQICDTFQQFCDFVPQYLTQGINLQCQEYIKGEDKDCLFYQFYRDIEGNITECMGEKTLQTNGIMTLGTTKYDETLAEVCRNFLQSIGYVGIGGIEFKHSEGKYYFIEMSTRTEGFLSISDMADVSLAEVSFLSMNGRSCRQQKQKEGVQYVVFLPFLRSSRKGRNLFYAISQIIYVVLSRKSKLAGAFLDLCFALKLDLNLIK